MNNERAIELLHRLQDEQFDGIHGDERREALEMAVRALEPNLGQKTIDCIIERLYGENRTTDDTIYRQQAIDAVADGLKGIFVEYRDIAEKMIGKLPSAQQQRKKGKWIKLDMHAHIADHKCTACGQECYVPTCMGEPMYTYCPNCGADMRGESDE